MNQLDALPRFLPVMRHVQLLLLVHPVDTTWRSPNCTVYTLKSVDATLAIIEQLQCFRLTVHMVGHAAM